MILQFLKTHFLYIHNIIKTLSLHEIINDLHINYHRPMHMPQP